MKKIAVLPLVSFFNHSCWPNAAAYPSHEDVCYVFAIQDIKQGTFGNLNLQGVMTVIQVRRCVLTIVLE